MALAVRVDQQELLDVLSKWWITTAVMGSLLMQLLLLLTGGTRKWSMASRFVAWNAYTWSDFIATSALGSLAQSAVGNAHQKEVYAIWAPMLLLHLGAPDNIAAYALADAELWQRHGLNMLLQIAIVIYVVASCARGWKYVLLSICLTVLGSIKYAERTLALKRASHADVVKSALPIYKYMLAEAHINLRKGLDSSVSSSRRQPASHTPDSNPSYYYIIQGEKQWLRNFLKADNTNYIHSFQDAALATPGFVTLQDVLSSQQLRQAAPSMVLLCAGFALFKLYKRRLSGLYMYEWREEKTIELFMQRRVLEDVKEVMFVLDVELRFLFDSLYTKAAGTAFSKLGVCFRMLTTILLVVSGVFIFGSLDFNDQAIEQARNVTFCLIAAAIIIETYQLARLALSDWSRVWLMCSYIVVGEGLKNRSSWGISRYLRGLWLSILLRLIKLSGLMGRHEYWRSSIGQYTMLRVERQSVWRCMNTKLARLMRKDQLELVPWYVHDKQVVKKFKSYVLTKALASCQRISRTQQALPPFWFLPKYNDPQLRTIMKAALGALDQPDDQFFTDLEHLMVNWHVATCVCEVIAAHPPAHHASVVADDNRRTDIPHSSGDTSSPVESSAAGREAETNNVDLQMSKLLSRYMMYLLVHKTELLPCHADIARQTAADTQRDMCALTWNTELIMKLQNMSMTQNNEDQVRNIPNLPFNLKSGMMAGGLLQALSSDVRWRLVADVWVDILVCSASVNKPTEQIQQLTLGGEFLTHLWVLLGHMGYGAQ